MERCERYRHLLAAEAGNDLEPGLSSILRSHLGSCASCRSELDAYGNVILLARNAFQEAPVLPASVRARVLATAAEAASRPRFWQGWLSNPLRPALAGATAAAALVMVTMMVGRAWKPEADQSDYAPVKIEMQVQQDGKVRLAWQDGRREVYRVRKSRDPKGLSGAETHLVRGNSWVDENPTSSPVVFYQVN
jgi:predicted anti-sigma-YlaC factor YlaD